MGRWPAGGPHPPSPASKCHRSGPVVPAANLPPRKGDSTFIGQAAAWPRLSPSDLDSTFNASGRPDCAPISACVGAPREFFASLWTGRAAFRPAAWSFEAVVSHDRHLPRGPTLAGALPVEAPLGGCFEDPPQVDRGRAKPIRGHRVRPPRLGNPQPGRPPSILHPGVALMLDKSP